MANILRRDMIINHVKSLIKSLNATEDLSSTTVGGLLAFIEANTAELVEA